MYRIRRRLVTYETYKVEAASAAEAEENIDSGDGALVNDSDVQDEATISIEWFDGDEWVPEPVPQEEEN